MPAIRESIVEKQIRLWAMDRGIQVRKFTSPGRKGVPDRLFFKAGKHLFLEIKRPGEKPEPLQLREMRILNSEGMQADWCDNAARGIELLQFHIQQL